MDAFSCVPWSLGCSLAVFYDVAAYVVLLGDQGDGGVIRDHVFFSLTIMPSRKPTTQSTQHRLQKNIYIFLHTFADNDLQQAVEI